MAQWEGILGSLHCDSCSDWCLYWRNREKLYVPPVLLKDNIILIFLAAIETGSPIMIHPQFNPMIGPSTYVQINMGARFVPCMRTIPEVQNSTVHVNWPCPNTTSSDSNNPSNHCDLAALCGFSAESSA